MAPGTILPEQPPAAAYGKPFLGPKETFIGGPKAYNADIEEKGNEHQAPATHPNYLPVWDKETKYNGLPIVMMHILV